MQDVLICGVCGADKRAVRVDAITMGLRVVDVVTAQAHLGQLWQAVWKTENGSPLGKDEYIELFFEVERYVVHLFAEVSAQEITEMDVWAMPTVSDPGTLVPNGPVNRAIPRASTMLITSGPTVTDPGIWTYGRWLFPPAEMARTQRVMARNTQAIVRLTNRGGKDSHLEALFWWYEETGEG